MFARIVIRTVFFVFVCLVSAFGQEQTVPVRLESGWNPQFVARQKTTDPSNFNKFTYTDLKGNDITDKVVDSKTGHEKPLAHHLPVGTIIHIPTSLMKATTEVAPQGKTMSQLCAEYKFWNCRRVEIVNHIPSMHKALTESIWVPKTEQDAPVTVTPELIPAPAQKSTQNNKPSEKPVDTLNDDKNVTYKFPAAELIISLLAALIAATISAALILFPHAVIRTVENIPAYIVRRWITCRALYKSLLDAIVRHIRYTSYSLYRSFRTIRFNRLRLPEFWIQRFEKRKITVHERMELVAFGDAYLHFFDRGPKPVGTNSRFHSWYKLNKKLRIYVFPSGNRQFPNMTKYRKQVLETEELILKQPFARGFCRSDVPRNSISWRHAKLGVRFEYYQHKGE